MMPSMPVNTSTWRNANTLADGRLDAELRRMHAAGLSHARIVARLIADHQIEVSAPTAGAWLAAALDAPDEQAS